MGSKATPQEDKDETLQFLGPNDGRLQSLYQTEHVIRERPEIAQRVRNFVSKCLCMEIEDYFYSLQLHMALGEERDDATR